MDDVCHEGDMKQITSELKCSEIEDEEMHSRIHSHSVRHLGFKPEVARAFNECLIDSLREVRNVYAQYAGIRTKVFGGVETMDDKGTVLKNIEECSDIVIGLPGRIKALVDFGVLKLRVTRRFVHSLWKEIPRSAQVMSFSSTLDIRARKWCRGLMSSLRVEQFNKVLDVSRASLVIKYDVLGDAKAYRRRMAYLEHATPKAKVVSFMTTEYDRAVLRNVQECYKIRIHKYTDAATSQVASQVAPAEY
ncbi:Suppressor of the cold-sensitive snRNP biogenesis mutant brr1-1 [Haplosporangium bisporale]|nr:Suppressor of the cold-sensitive snRNP biogenesis mutant brr1-1 [Haplosporangium bisporale]